MRRLGEEAVREIGAQVVARSLGPDLGAKPLVEGDRVELACPWVLPRRFRIELLREGVELRVALLQLALVVRRQGGVVARMALRPA